MYHLRKNPIPPLSAKLSSVELAWNCLVWSSLCKAKTRCFRNRSNDYFYIPPPWILQYTGIVLAGRWCGALVSCPWAGHQTIRNRLCQRGGSLSSGTAGPGEMMWRGTPWTAPAWTSYPTPSPNQHPVCLLKNSTLCSQGNNLLYLPPQNSTQPHTRLIKRSWCNKFFTFSSFYNKLLHLPYIPALSGNSTLCFKNTFHISWVQKEREESIRRDISMCSRFWIMSLSSNGYLWASYTLGIIIHYSSTPQTKNWHAIHQDNYFWFCKYV